MKTKNNKITLLSEVEMSKVKGGWVIPLLVITYNVLKSRKDRPSTMTSEDMEAWVEGVGGVEYYPEDWGY